MGTIIAQSNLVQLTRLQALKCALKLEIKGLKNSRQSVYALIKKEFGFKGNKQRVLEQFTEYIKTREVEAGV